ncbi:MAG: 16S rRNA (uracil(1498)-N(3))-methyltransferase [Deltaproteobacteria bacterium]|nr:16S rRNA (uracil(1498)-N(3))-methyltransferase [Candidatus Zymogenaceae bacterium]
MTRFFCDRELEPGDTVDLNDEESHHLLVVLRAGTGDRVLLADGAGREWTAVVEKRGSSRAHLTVEELSRESEMCPFELYLYPGLLKGKKLERVVRDAVELGVSAVVPCVTARSISRDMSDVKKTRLEAIAREESKLTRRNRAMAVLDVVDFTGAVRDAPGMKLFVWEEANDFLGDRLEEVGGPREKVSVFTGPEGGFSPEEAVLAGEAGCLAVSLGDRILRAETAPGVTVTMIQYAWGGFVRT